MTDTKRLTMKTVKKSDLIGRTIVDVDFHPFPTGRRRRISYDPILMLDNGKRISFCVDETEVGRYGIRLQTFPQRTGIPRRSS